MRASASLEAQATSTSSPRSHIVQRGVTTTMASSSRIAVEYCTSSRDAATKFELPKAEAIIFISAHSLFFFVGTCGECNSRKAAALAQGKYSTSNSSTEEEELY